MNNTIKTALLEYLKTGLSAMPTEANKRPATASWTDFQNTKLTEEEINKLLKYEIIRPHLVSEYPYKLKNTEVIGIGILGGKISGNLEVIDVDCKYDLTGLLWDNLFENIKTELPDIYKSLVIAKTPTGGYHIYYKCDVIGKNQKLARRETTEEEKKQIQIEAEKVKDKKTAKAEGENDKVKVLIETRGEGGYVCAEPTPGYKFIQNTFRDIPKISIEKRDRLLDICRDFNEVEEQKEKPKTNKTIFSNVSLEDPFSDYNERGDILTLLESKGWNIVKQTSKRVYLLRPGGGSSSAKYSANYHLDKKLFYVWSDSVLDFEAEKGYNNVSVFLKLECNEDTKLAYQKLIELGYGKVNTYFNNTYYYKVNGVNIVNRLTDKLIISANKDLTQDLIKDIPTLEFLIKPEKDATGEEIIKAIEFLIKNNKNSYVYFSDNTHRDYVYILNYLFNKYGELQGDNLTLEDIHKDEFLEDIVNYGAFLQAIDKDQYIELFLNNQAIKNLGIKKESLQEAIDRLNLKRAKTKQKQELDKLLLKISDLQNKGETEEAIKLIENKINGIKEKSLELNFDRLLINKKLDSLYKELLETKNHLNSGYKIGGDDITLPPGAISVLSAPTSHGKTTFLINILLNLTERYKDKEFYFLSFEEDENNILLKTINTFCNVDIGKNNREEIKKLHYPSLGDLIGEAPKRKEIKDKTDVFFKDYIDTRRVSIKYCDYNAEELVGAIKYLKKNTNVGAILIDYIQLINLPKGKNNNYSRQQELKEICIMLKDVAIETGLPIIVGAQFNREVVNPLLLHASKIGEAGDIERIASLIIGFWNLGFNPLATDNELKKMNELLIGSGNIYTKILKNREGAVGGEEFLKFNGNTGKISNSY